jgi:hypothetical protein
MPRVTGIVGVKMEVHVARLRIMGVSVQVDAVAA